MPESKTTSTLSLRDRLLLFYGVSLPNHPRKWWVQAQLRRLFRARPTGEFEVERQGLRWRINPADFEQESLFWLGGMDTWDIHHLKSLLSAGGVFFDVGANSGYYSLTVSKYLQGRCKVFAFEPNPRTRERLLWNVAANAMDEVVTVLPVALSDMSGAGTLIERSDNSGASRLGSDANGVSVEVTTLDQFCQGHAMEKIDVVKIDVEGYEVKVLQGALTTLQRFKPALIVEFWTPGLSRAAATVDEIAELLQAFGYKLFRAERSVLVPVADLPRGETPVNLFAFHQQRPQESFRRD